MEGGLQRTRNWSVQGSGAKSVYTANIGTKEFKIPFDATGKKWIRFSVWDSAGDGAFANPINLK
jgi:hypothetical protein